MRKMKPPQGKTDIQATAKSCRRTVDTMAPSRRGLLHRRIRALGQRESSHFLAAQIGEKIARRGLQSAETWRLHNGHRKRLQVKLLTPSMTRSRSLDCNRAGHGQGKRRSYERCNDCRKRQLRPMGLTEM